jgi:glycine/D-amino acid oxidase-like deaminating enzyme
VDADLSDYRALSFWHDTVPDELTPRAALPGDTQADVAIIGGGLTGLWTAYYLLTASPGLRVVVLEKEIAGFGASGRNGGWCSALFPRSTASLERAHGREAALAMRRAMIETVDEVGRVAAKEDIHCDFAKGGTIAFARTPVQAKAADEEIAEAESYGVDALERHEGYVLDPNCARVHPAKLVRGLARVVERLGGVIYEQTTVQSWASGSVVTDHGTVTAPTVVVALEGYGASIPQSHRRVLPLYSLMIATEPLTDAQWDEIGIQHGQTFTDYRHLLVYGQRTADNRFAFGGRGARYHWGSAIKPGYDKSPRVFDHLKTALDELFPEIGGVRVTHRWGGPLGVPRDWHAGVTFDPASGLATAGGYVGDGLSTTNIAGRTLADLILRRDTPLTGLAWVGHRSPDWEIEPLRFVGANLGMLAMDIADTEERLTSRPSVAARVMGPLVGH